MQGAAGGGARGRRGIGPWWTIALLLFAFACGVKAPPQPPGMPPARRGEPLRICPGCELPAPDAYPSPSTDGEELPEEREGEGEPAVPDDEEPEGPSPEGPGAD